MMKQRVHTQFIVKKGKVGTPAKCPTLPQLIAVSIAYKLLKCCSPKRELVSLRLPFPTPSQKYVLYFSIYNLKCITVLTVLIITILTKSTGMKDITTHTNS